jgi:protein-S-isoprenylcysteine O-methyltransferase Ste14
MKILKELFGYLLGGVLFVGLIPFIMWLASGAPELLPIGILRLIVGIILATAGLATSVWSIVYMRCKGNGNPMDAFGHEVAPRTQHLMTDGPYRLSRNPMLTGTFIYLIGICVLLFTWQSIVVFVAFVLIMLVQVRTEEKRLSRDFGDEYEAYCHRTGRFLPIGKC